MRSIYILSLTLQLTLINSVWAENHSLVITHFNNDTFKMNIDTKSIATNGSQSPGLFLQTDNDRELGYDQQMRWVKKPQAKESVLYGERVVLNAQQSLPVRILFSGRDPIGASAALAKIIKESPDKLQFSFDAREGHSQSKPRTIQVSGYPDKKKNEGGEISYNQLEYVIPESEVMVKNLKTNKSMPLSEFIDQHFDRSLNTTVREFFDRKFGGGKKAIEVKDSPRGAKEVTYPVSSGKVARPQNASDR